VATSSNSSTNINLNHDDVGLVLVIVLNAPSSELVITDACSNFDKVLSDLLALRIVCIILANFPNHPKVLYSLRTQLLFKFKHLARIFLQLPATTSCHLIGIEGYQKIIWVRKHVSPRMPNARPSSTLTQKHRVSSNKLLNLRYLFSRREISWI
jgi:hypothetical protein